MNDFRHQAQARGSRRTEIREFFLAHLGERFSSAELHTRFGSAFRTRASELNRDSACPIHIRNKTSVGRDERGQPREQSSYWAELRAPAQHIESEYMRRTQDERARAMPLFAGAEHEGPLFAETAVRR
jgi:hypothetical protein